LRHFYPSYSQTRRHRYWIPDACPQVRIAKPGHATDVHGHFGLVSRRGRCAPPFVHSQPNFSLVSFFTLLIPPGLHKESELKLLSFQVFFRFSLSFMLFFFFHYPCVDTRRYSRFASESTSLFFSFLGRVPSFQSSLFILPSLLNVFLSPLSRDFSLCTSPIISCS